MTLPEQDLSHVAEHVHCWDRLRGKRIFLTGASGFIGTWLAESLFWANFHFHLEAELIRMPRVNFPNGPFDYGIHAARLDDAQADIAFTRCVLDFAAQAGVQALLYTSSGAVDAPLPQTTNGGSSYANAKRTGEKLCAEFALRYGFRAVIARLFAFAGPGLPLDRNFAIGNFVRDALRGGPIVIEGDGTPIRSYLYAADLAVWLWTLLLEGESAKPYNVGSPNAVSIRELAEAVAAEKHVEIVILRRAATGVAAAYVPNVDRAKNDLHLLALIPLEEGIRRMFTWHLKAKQRELQAPAATIT